MPQRTPRWPKPSSRRSASCARSKSMTDACAHLPHSSPPSSSPSDLPLTPSQCARSRSATTRACATPTSSSRPPRPSTTSSPSSRPRTSTCASSRSSSSASSSPTARSRSSSTSSRPQAASAGSSRRSTTRARSSATVRPASLVPLAPLLLATVELTLLLLPRRVSPPPHRSHDPERRHPEAPRVRGRVRQAVQHRPVRGRHWQRRHCRAGLPRRHRWAFAVERLEPGASISVPRTHRAAKLTP